ncbi:hypothetical protein [Levilactobacillus acidifarinae]|uniref:hypothetical protein n=1 Tax=Levilactobacillus acidifarinae TaxID=267364 RepID=UPI00070A9D9B|nr:hypothetical protein [Levilactobacillus acidifarinae]GEO70550.1 hypothetical protein LAC03_24600 [Levilactobacillus acidifarinae]
MFIYILYGEDGFITDFKTENTEGYTKVFLINRWLSNFMKYSKKFRYDGEQLLNPGNLPAATVTSLESTMRGLQDKTVQATTATTKLAENQTNLSTGLSQVQQAITTLALKQTASSTEGDD